MANLKSPISILQEFLIQEKKVPLYQELLSDLPQYAFKCVVTFDSIKAFGYAHTKKGAKHNCALEALLKIGVGVSDKIINNSSRKFDVSPTHNMNYIAKLNDISPDKCNKANFKNPISLLQETLMQEKKVPLYQERCSDLAEFPYKFMVTFDSITTFGYAHTKKGAKLNCAKEALLKIGVGTSHKIINNSSTNSLTNSVGKVKEFDTNTKIADDKLPKNEEFAVECQFKELQTKEGSRLQSIKINVRNANSNKSN